LANLSLAVLVLGCGGKSLVIDDRGEATSASGSTSIGGTSSAGGSSNSGGETTSAGALATGGAIAVGGAIAAGGSPAPDKPVVNACNGAQIVLVIQRSLFGRGSKYENGVHITLVGVVGYSGALSGYWSKLDVGALFFAGQQTDDQLRCPIMSSVVPQANSSTLINQLMDSNYDEYAANSQATMTAPVPQAISAAASLLRGSNRHLVLITQGAPSNCGQTSDGCAVDASIKAVQDANQLGITTHVIGLGTTDELNVPGDDQGYDTYLNQLANAGVGQPVQRSVGSDTRCKDGSTQATYSDANGDTRAYRSEHDGIGDAAIIDILKKLCP